MLRVTFNHGLRVSETLALRAENIVNGYLTVPRQKKSNPVCHPLCADEKQGLEDLAKKSYGRLFSITRMTFWRKMQRYGAEAGIPFFLRHPHALRHTCGRLGFLGGMKIPEVVMYLGHKNPGNSLRYMQASEEEACAAFAAAIGGNTK